VRSWHLDQPRGRKGSRFYAFSTVSLGGGIGYNPFI
jgi:hypothetical protein